MLARNLFDEGDTHSVPDLARYVFAEAGKLEEQSLETIVAGRIELELAA